MPALRLALGLLLVAAVRAGAQEPAKFFEDNCSPCHAIGGPPGGAPDLKDVSKRRDHAWLVRFILNAEAVARKDATAAALVKRYDGTIMPPTEGATPEFIDALLRYIDRGSTGAVPTAVSERAVTAADVAAGRAWYDGRRPLERRGPACVSCHQIESIGRFGGGTLGPDLTQVHRRLGGAGGVTKWLNNPPTRVMRAVFRNQPLTDEEAFAIGALLADESARHAGTAPRAPTAVFAASGAAAALLGLAAMGLLWSRRLRSVRRPMVDAARKG
jgi:mono/diheme cytochrome c family protein